MELSGVSRATGPSQPLARSRRAEDVILALSSRPTGAEPAPQRRSPAAKGDDRVAAAEPAARAPPSPPFEWLDLEIIPLGQKPDPRGYAVYSQKPRPAPAPVILIDAA